MFQLASQAVRSQLAFVSELRSLSGLPMLRVLRASSARRSVAILAIIACVSGCQAERKDLASNDANSQSKVSKPTTEPTRSASETDKPLATTSPTTKRAPTPAGQISVDKDGFVTLGNGSEQDRMRMPTRIPSPSPSRRRLCQLPRHPHRKTWLLEKAGPSCLCRRPHRA